MFPLVATGINYTCGKFATSIKDTSCTGGKFAASVIDIGGKFATGMSLNTGGAH
jgi:hypothetical protein